MMLNALISNFAGMPALMNPEFGEQATQALRTLAASPRFSELMEMASAGDDFWPEEDNWRSYYRPYKVSADGTLQIPISGVMLNSFPYTTSYATGYTYIRKAFERGMSDPKVSRIAMVINSGGGEVAGNFDLVDAIFKMRGSKPIHAFVNEHAYSAAYSLASAADKISIVRTGGAGSIGVVTSHVDVSEAVDKAGYKITFVYAGKHKVDGNPYEPLSKDVKNRMQARINDIYNVFVSTVARNRSLSEDSVRATEALTYSAEEAVTVGLVDSIAPFDEALAAFSGGDNQVENHMTQAADHTADISAQLDAARREGAVAGAKAERERIQKILGCDAAKTRQTLASHMAMKTDQSAESAIELLGMAAEENKPEASVSTAQSAFEHAMNTTQNPEVGADSGNSQPVSAVDQVMADYRAATGQVK